MKTKRKRITIPVKVPVALLNDGTNSPVPSPNAPVVLAEGEAALYKQADNPLGDPHKI
jgi:hypothetical protein